MNPIYFAFGSNLADEQMLERCPSAVLLGPASLRGYRLAFAGHSWAWNGAVATIVPARGEGVPGLLYRLSPGDLARLDSFEGAPHVYARRLHRVFDDGARTVRRAHIYELVAPGRPGKPSLEYVLTIFDAYRQHGLAMSALSSALARSGAAAP